MSATSQSFVDELGTAERSGVAYRGVSLNYRFVVPANHADGMAIGAGNGA